MKTKLAIAATAFVACFGLSVPSASAALVTYNFDVTTSGYSDAVGTAPAPIDPLNVDFRVTFDPTQQNLGLPVTFDSPINPAFGSLNLLFYNSINVATFNLQGGDGTTSLNIQLVTATPTLVPGNYPFIVGANDFGAYTFNAGADLFVSSAGDVVITSVSAVPEPAGWAMMLLGIGAVGFALRRRPLALMV